MSSTCGRSEISLAGSISMDPARERLPNTLNISIDGTNGHELLSAAPIVAASTGSACHSGEHSPSPVLMAMGVGLERAATALTEATRNG